MADTLFRFAENIKTIEDEDEDNYEEEETPVELKSKSTDG